MYQKKKNLTLEQIMKYEMLQFWAKVGLKLPISPKPRFQLTVINFVTILSHNTAVSRNIRMQDF